jgi:dTMP kinase
MFIVLEGLDGSGSSTQVSLLAHKLQQLNHEVVATKEPTTGVIGQVIRDCLQHKFTVDPKALQLLFAADRADHIQTLIKPNLAKNKIVISDRYFFSSIAFGALELNFDFLSNLYQDFLIPDLVFLLKVPPAECIKRINKRGNEKELFEKKSTLTKVWEHYEKLAKLYPNIHIIDGTQSIEVINVQILNVVEFVQH